jgi:3-oxoadipate enol-lactonase
MGPRDVWDERIALVREQGMQAVAVGEHDPGTTVAHAQEIQTRIPKARLQIIPEAAHLVNVEQSGDFNRMLLNFLGPAKA